MNKYILLTNIAGDSVAINIQRVVIVETNNSDNVIKSPICKTTICMTDSCCVDVREPIANVLAMLNDAELKNVTQYR